MTAIISLIILICSVVAHEVAHGYAAKWEGDETASRLGRLSGNPLKHIDPFGSVIVPALSFLLGGFVIGWAKPVPIDPRNFRHERWGEAIVAFAGPFTNILFAVLFSAVVRYAPLSTPALSVAAAIVLINIVLAFFNLIPIPPMDGSRILASAFPGLRGFFYSIERYGVLLPLLLALLAWQALYQFAEALFYLFTGLR